MVSAVASGFPRIPSGRGFDRLFSPFDDQFHQRPVIERRKFLAVLGPDIHVEQAPHGRLVHLHVDVIAAGQLDLLADLLVMAYFGLDLPRLGVGVTGLAHLVGQVGVGAQERRNQLVEGYALRLVFLELLGVAALGGAEKTQIGRGVARRLDRLA